MALSWPAGKRRRHTGDRLLSVALYPQLSRNRSGNRNPAHLSRSPTADVKHGACFPSEAPVVLTRERFREHQSSLQLAADRACFAHPEKTAKSAPPPPDPLPPHAPDASSPLDTESRAPPGSSAAHPTASPAAPSSPPAPRQTSAPAPSAHSPHPINEQDRPPQSPRTHTSGIAAPATADPPADSASAPASSLAAPANPAHRKPPLQSASSRYPIPDNEPENESDRP